MQGAKRPDEYPDAWVGHTLEDGSPTFLNVPAALHKSDLKGAEVVFIGVPGALNPVQTRKSSVRLTSTYLPEYDLEVGELLRMVDYGDVAVDPLDVAASVASVETRVMHALEAGAVPITLGGDAPLSGYSSACALSRFLDGGPVGAINLDALADVRDGAGLNERNWVQHQWHLPGFAAKNHAQVGLHGPGSARAGVAQYRQQGSLLLTGRDVFEREPNAVLREVIERTANTTRGIWFGVDWSVLEPGSPFALRPELILQLAFEAGRHGGLSLCTMAVLDAAHMHTMTVTTVLHFLAGVAVRRGKAEVKPWL